MKDVRLKVICLNIRNAKYFAIRTSMDGGDTQFEKAKKDQK